jgi:hypothetical protein
MLRDDPHFQRIYAQVLKMWRAMDHGTPDEVDAETQALTQLIEASETNREP